MIPGEREKGGQPIAIYRNIMGNPGQVAQFENATHNFFYKF
jgi:hypothetical protein